MDKTLDDAIEVLLKKLEAQEKVVIDTKRIINSLLEMMGKSPKFKDTELEKSQNIIRPDMYYGKRLATCVREYLDMKGNACTAKEILDALQQGGFNFVPLEWQEKSRLRNLSISIAKNTSSFHRLPNGTFGLLSWYPDIQKKKSQQEKIQNSKAENQITDEINKNEKEKIQDVIIE